MTTDNKKVSDTDAKVNMQEEKGAPHMSDTLTKEPIKEGAAATDRKSESVAK